MQKTMSYLFWLLMVITTYLLLIELAPSESGFPHADKLIHLGAFFLLCITGYLSFPDSSIFVSVGLAFYGAITEALQHLLTATRHASLLDWVADISGILLCLLLVRLFKNTD